MGTRGFEKLYVPGLHGLSTTYPFDHIFSAIPGGGRNGCLGPCSKGLRAGPGYDALLYEFFVHIHDITPFQVQDTLSAPRSETLALFFFLDLAQNPPHFDSSCLYLLFHALSSDFTVIFYPGLWIVQ